MTKKQSKTQLTPARLRQLVGKKINPRPDVMAENNKKDLSLIINLLLIILLVVASFFGGSFFKNLKTLKKENAGQESQSNGGKNETLEDKKTKDKIPPSKPVGVLGNEDQAKIMDTNIVKGDSEAPVTIVEFSEYQCPYCAEYVGVNVNSGIAIDQEKTYQKIMDQYVNSGKARYIFRDFPSASHQHAQKTAEAARCVGEQGQYWQYHDLLFKNYQKWVSESDPTPVLKELVGELGLDQGLFSQCLNSGKYTQIVKDDYELGRKVGVYGTPTFFINGRRLNGARPFSAFKKIIDEELSNLML